MTSQAASGEKILHETNLWLFECWDHVNIMTPIRLAEGKYQTGKDEQKCISKPKEPSEVSKNNEEKLQLNKANRKIPQKT